MPPQRRVGGHINLLLSCPSSVMSLYMYIYIFLYIQNMTALVLNTKTFCPKQSCMKKNPLFDLVVKGLDHCDLHDTVAHPRMKSQWSRPLTTISNNGFFISYNFVWSRMFCIKAQWLHVLKQSCMKKNPLFDLVVKGLDHCDLILGCATVPCPYIYKYIYIYMQNMMILGLEYTLTLDIKVK
jgi:hypothetical protein